VWLECRGKERGSHPSNPSSITKKKKHPERGKKKEVVSTINLVNQWEGRGGGKKEEKVNMSFLDLGRRGKKKRGEGPEGRSIWSNLRDF